MLTPTEKTRILATLEELQIHVETLPTSTPCVKCDYFESGGHCRRWGQRVPAEHLDTGCAEWKEGAPF